VPSELRPATVDDVEEVLAFWREAAQATSTDTSEALVGLIRRDPGALIVAESDGRIVGTVIAGWDGWRGSIYRLVVAPSHRRRGLGRQLLGAAEARLAAVGAVRMQAIVVETEPQAMGFWRESAWEEQVHRARFVRG
jgi:ribosomal protein S18 acetylase RimI-like enzyme